MLVLVTRFEGLKDGSVGVCYSIGSYPTDNITHIADSGGLPRTSYTNL